MPTADATRPQLSIDNEVFALRDNELMQLFTKRPEGRFIAVMARSVEMPDGPRSPVRTADGAPVEQAAILGALWNYSQQCWQWTQISPPSKERIGDLIFDSGASKDCWYYLAITDSATGDTK